MMIKSPTSPFHCPICRENVTEWLGGVMHGFLDKTTEVDDADERFKQFFGKSIVMDLRFGDLEMANVGTTIFADIWGMDALAGSSTRPAASNS